MLTFRCGVCELVYAREFLDGRLVGESPGCIGEREGGESPGSSVWLRRGGGQVCKTLA